MKFKFKKIRKITDQEAIYCLEKFFKQKTVLPNDENLRNEIIKYYANMVREIINDAYHDPDNKNEETKIDVLLDEYLDINNTSKDIDDLYDYLIDIKVLEKIK